MIEKFVIDNNITSAVRGAFKLLAKSGILGQLKKGSRHLKKCLKRVRKQKDAKKRDSKLRKSNAKNESL